MNQPISSNKAPAPIGPYSQAILVPPGQEVLFLSGQIPLDAEGGMVDGGIEPQTRQVLENMTAVLEAAGHGWTNVCKVNIFLADMGDFLTVNGIYGEYVKEPYPARAAVQVTRLPKDVLVEIEAISSR